MPCYRITGLLVGAMWLWTANAAATASSSSSAAATIDADGQVHHEHQQQQQQQQQQKIVVPRDPFYGADVSWPMHQEHVNRDNNPLGGQARQDAYEGYMAQCLKISSSCRSHEMDRINMNRNQPAMMRNFTHAGYARVKTPPKVQELLETLWEEHSSDAHTELWSPGDVYVNHWEVPTQMLDVQKYTTRAQQAEMIRSIQSVLEAWTRQSLVLTSMYGIRVYHEGAILAPHVDRLPLVSSAIINVAQGDMEEPWILEVIGHDGLSHNVTMEPGAMVLYESHSILHGRPYPLKGSYFANIFVHFEPLGYSLRHAQQYQNGNDHNNNLNNNNKHLEAAYQRALLESQQQQSEEYFPNRRKRSSEALPPYVDPARGTEWKQQYEFDREPGISPKPTKMITGQNNNPHRLAAKGELSALKQLAQKDRAKLFKADSNGWRPLHEAARAGHDNVVEYLLKEGAQVNERTNQGEGGNALWWAEKEPRQNKRAIEVLKKYGAVLLAPKSVEKEKAKKEAKEQAAAKEKEAKEKQAAKEEKVQA